MSDYLNIFEEPDALDEMKIVYNTNAYENSLQSSGGSSGVYTSLSKIKNLMRSRVNSAYQAVRGTNYADNTGAYTGAYNNDPNNYSGRYNNDNPNIYSGRYNNNPGSYTGKYNNDPGSYTGKYNNQAGLPPGYVSSYNSKVAAPPPQTSGGASSSRVVNQANMGQTRQLLDMDGYGKMHDQRAGTVEYMDAQRAATFQVIMGKVLMRRGEVFDTKSKKMKYKAAARADPDKPMAASAAASMGLTQEAARRWARESMIWVCSSGSAASKVAFYSGVGKLDRLHHSSFTSGSAIVGAGEWIVDKGELVAISAVSGHYRPTMDALYASVLHMAQAFTARTTVLLWDTRTKAWIDRPVRAFITAPSNNGMYKVHPQA